MDAPTAFSNGTIDVVLSMEQPKGYSEQGMRII